MIRRTILLLLLSPVSALWSQSNIESLLLEATTKEAQARSYYKAAYDLYGENDSLSLVYLDIAIELAEVSSTTKILASANYLKGDICYQNNDLLNGWIAANRSLELFIELNDAYYKAASLRLLGYLCLETKEFRKAEDYFTRAQGFFIETGAKSSIARSNYSLGMLNYETGNFPKAISNFTLANHDLPSNTEYLPELHLYIANSYFHMDDSVNSMQAFEMALSIAKANDDIVRLSKCLNDLGQKTAKWGKAGAGYNLVLQAYEGIEASNRFQDQAIYLNNLAEISLELKDTIQAISHLLEVAALENNLISLEQLSKSIDLAFLIYEKSGVYPGFEKFGRLSVRVNDTRDSVLRRADLLYNKEQLAFARQEIQEEKKASEQLAYLQKKHWMLISAVVALCAIIIYLLFYRRKLYKRYRGMVSKVRRYDAIMRNQDETMIREFPMSRKVWNKIRRGD